MEVVVKVQEKAAGGRKQAFSHSLFCRREKDEKKQKGRKKEQETFEVDQQVQRILAADLYTRG